MAKESLLRASEEQTLASRGYRLIKKLGEGSYANVYLAEFFSVTDERQNRYLACKVVDVSKAPKDFVKKFLPRELDILVRLNHPHIIHIHSIFQRKTKYFVFMRNAEKGDLLEYVLKRGPVSEAQARVWIRQLALGVQYLHSMDIAHRDLKCENCLITSNYNLKLADFGFARFVMDNNGKQVLSSTYCGSLSYAAPEVLRGLPYYPKMADVWSCGVIIYVCINKAMPFDDTNVKRLHEQQVSKRWKFRSKVVDNLSEQVKQLVTHLLEPDITKRWNMDRLVQSDWIIMDPRFQVLTKAEETALAQSSVERRTYLEGVNKKTKDSFKIKNEADDMKVLKPTTHEDHVPRVDLESVVTVAEE
ncbi:unnamed protein product [Ceutorhynchus assimilis]|uniref:Protein kinase domain-containing protein n=1 Tax=Ceutorhynchus assimilis TaxID=467358 RepID=A0A9N9QNQ0_9CUCU|nr:unnamed protein product [Ceutorhynchus assimilis]